MPKFDNSLESLKLANMKLMLTADASFEEKHPRDGGKFTSKGGGESKKDDKKSSGAKEIWDNYTDEQKRNVYSTYSGIKPKDVDIGGMEFEDTPKYVQKYLNDKQSESSEGKLEDANKKEVAEIRDSQKIADSLLIDGLELERFTKLLNLDKKDAQAIRHRIAEERAVSALSKKDKKFADKLETALTEQESIENSKEALSIMSDSEKSMVKQFMKENPGRNQSKELSDESKATLSKLNDVTKMLLSNAKANTRTGGITQMQGKLQTGSLQDRYTDQNGHHFASYFLINDSENMKGWGVTTESIPRHIGSFKGMPFVVTAKRFFEKSPYGEMTDHPSTDHFASLGIKIGGGLGPMWRVKEHNDLMQQAKFQEEFRVGNIDEVFRKDNGDWHALVRIKPEFASMQMPTQVSPALFQLNPEEPQNKITTWVGMHLAGLDESPAYGNVAVFKGTCFGTSGECMRKLSAGMNEPFMPCFKGKLAKFNLHLAQIRLDIIRKEAAQMAGDHSNIQHQNILSEDDTPDYSSKDIVHEI